MNLEIQKEKFKDHVATFQDLGDIKILDFQRPGSVEYRIRFLFEEDHYRLHISGDLGELIAFNINNMRYATFGDFVHNPGYFKQKICCMSRDMYEYDIDKARKDLIEELDWYDWSEENKYSSWSLEERRDYEIDCILEDFCSRTGLGSKAYDKLSEIDPDCWEWISYIGREDTGIIELYLYAFELAQKQLAESKNLESIGERQHD